MNRTRSSRSSVPRGTRGWPNDTGISVTYRPDPEPFAQSNILASSAWTAEPTNGAHPSCGLTGSMPSSFMAICRSHGEPTSIGPRVLCALRLSEESRLVFAENVSLSRAAISFPRSLIDSASFSRGGTGNGWRMWLNGWRILSSRFGASWNGPTSASPPSSASDDVELADDPSLESFEVLADSWELDPPVAGGASADGPLGGVGEPASVVFGASSPAVVVGAAGAAVSARPRLTAGRALSFTAGTAADAGSGSSPGSGTVSVLRAFLALTPLVGHRSPPIRVSLWGSK